MKRIIYIPFDHLHRNFGALKEADPKQDVIAIGDSLRTDIAGANAFGIESIMVLTGVSKIEDIVDEKPTFIIKNLSEIYEN